MDTCLCVIDGVSAYHRRAADFVRTDQVGPRRVGLTGVADDRDGGRLLRAHHRLKLVTVHGYSYSLSSVMPAHHCAAQCVYTEHTLCRAAHAYTGKRRECFGCPADPLCVHIKQVRRPRWNYNRVRPSVRTRSRLMEELRRAVLESRCPGCTDMLDLRPGPGCVLIPLHCCCHCYTAAATPIPLLLPVYRCCYHCCLCFCMYCCRPFTAAAAATTVAATAATATPGMTAVLLLLLMVQSW